MNTLVAYFTKYGNTRTVASAVADVMAWNGEIRLLAVDRVTPEDLAWAEQVIVGSPTWYQAVPKPVKAAIKAWPKRSLKGKRFATFDTASEMWEPLMAMTASKGVAGLLRRLKGRPLGKPATFIVDTTEDPDHPDDREYNVVTLRDAAIGDATAWAKEIAAAATRT